MTTISKIERLMRKNASREDRRLGTIDVFADDREVMVDIRGRTTDTASVCVGVGPTLEAALADALGDCGVL